MKYLLSLVAACLSLTSTPLIGMAQEAAIDSSYRNWYFDSRQAFYESLEGTSYDVVFFGNSITERGDWQELLGSGIRVANRGIGGDNSFGLKARTPGIVQMQPDKVFILIGINDLNRGLPVQVILENYKQIITQFKVGSPRTELFLQSVLPLNETLLKVERLKGKAGLIHTLNKGIEALARQEELKYINLRPLFTSGDNVLDASLTADGIHLNPAAYIRWVDFLKDKKYL